MAASLLPMSILSAGCASDIPQARLRPDPRLTAEVIRQVSVQVRRCYRAPKVASVARQISTRLAVRYAADGSIVEIPVVLGQTGVTPANASYAGKMAEAATAAVIRCAPVNLPTNLYEQVWKELELTFSPARMV